MNKEEMDIFDLSAAKEESRFVKDSLLLESEIASDILEEMKEVPWVGSLIKLGDYIKPNHKDDYVTNNLYSSGLLQMTESRVEGSAFVVGGSYVLNDIGKHLLRILK